MNNKELLNPKESSEEIEQDIATEGELSGVESERADSDRGEYSTDDPFNPESISISSKTIALDTVLRRMNRGTLELAPDFQRNYVWDQSRKSQLIESMMLKIPLPMFYVSEDENGVWEVVDGLQRLTTIREFLLGKDGKGDGFRLTNLEFWGKYFNDKNYIEIKNDPSAARITNNIMESELSFTIINVGTPDKVRRNIFKRLNTGGMRLSDQEIRHALYQGEGTRLLAELVRNKVYLKVTGGSVKDARMSGREIILRYLSFYLLGMKNFHGDMDDFLSRTLMYLNGDNIDSLAILPTSEEIEAMFVKALQRSWKLFGEHSFRRSMPGNYRSPINKSLFELWLCIFSRMSSNDFELILKKKKMFLDKYCALFLYDEFSNSISRHGSTYRGVNYRYKKIGELLDSVLSET